MKKNGDNGEKKKYERVRKRRNRKKWTEHIDGF